MKAGAGLTARLARIILRILLRLDASELARVPRAGPLIIALNHVNFLDSPILLASLYPRELSALAKRETWENPFFGFLADRFEVIPVRRGESDLGALRRALEALAAGKILLIAPEGTRSRDGVLRKSKSGLAALAMRSGAPILPVGFVGLEDFGPYFRSLRRARVAVRVGSAFSLLPPGPGEAKTAREEASDEIMRRIARLLPENRQGEYKGRSSEPFLRTQEIG